MLLIEFALNSGPEAARPMDADVLRVKLCWPGPNPAAGPAGAEAVPAKVADICPAVMLLLPLPQCRGLQPQCQPSSDDRGMPRTSCSPGRVNTYVQHVGVKKSVRVNRV